MVLKKKLHQLQMWLKSNKLEAYIVPHADAFQSEYVPDDLDRLYKLTNFKGSAGLAVVTQTSAVLFVDSRYTLQAVKQSSDVYDIVNIEEKSYGAYILEKLKTKNKVGYDPMLLTVLQLAQLSKKLRKKQIGLVPVLENPIDTICGVGKLPEEALFYHPEKYSGLSSLEKRRQVMKNTSADCLLITDPCSIAWLLNLRGNDVPNTPIFLCYAILYKNTHCEVFINNPEKRTKKVNNVVEDIYFYPLECIHRTLVSLENKIISFNPNQVPVGISNDLSNKKNLEEINPCLMLKACKNKTEQAGMKACHIRDGSALVEFLYWLDFQVQQNKDITEYEAAQKLDSLRATKDLFVKASFSTISGSGPNGAIVHYCVEKETARVLQKGDIYLVDSGGQYWDGTTDVTRTVLFGGDASPEIREMYTRVLKGHIGIASKIFFKGTAGRDLDALARKSLWEVGCDYAHGTGHGVGHFSNVHESPPGINKHAAVPFEIGMVVSNEPGYYKEGSYGIRLESLLMVEESKQSFFLQFLTLTLAPFDRKLIDKSLLTFSEIQWINKYHQEVFKVLSPFFNVTEKKEIFCWLKEKTLEL